MMVRVLTDHELDMFPKLDRVAKLRALFGFDELEARLLDAFIATCVEMEREECAKIVEREAEPHDAEVIAKAIRERGKQ